MIIDPGKAGTAGALAPQLLASGATPPQLRCRNIPNTHTFVVSKGAATTTYTVRNAISECNFVRSAILAHHKRLGNTNKNSETVRH